ncbi:hypothetical protein ACJX0J_019694, partial [Zea mays]
SSFSLASLHRLGQCYIFIIKNCLMFIIFLVLQILVHFLISVVIGLVTLIGSLEIDLIYNTQQKITTAGLKYLYTAFHQYLLSVSKKQNFKGHNTCYTHAPGKKKTN